jgi:hypothetical protein
MALTTQEDNQESRLEALEFSLNLMWQEVAYIKAAVEALKSKG